MNRYTLCLLLSVPLLANCQAHKKSEEPSPSASKSVENQTENNEGPAENPNSSDANKSADKNEPTTPPAENPQPAPAPPAPAPPAPAPPAPTIATTHKVTVNCTNEVTINFAFNGTTGSLTFGKGPQVNGQPSSLLTVSCPKILTALNNKSFPVATTVSKPQGGPKVKVSCDSGVILMTALEGDPNGTFASVSKSLDLENVEVCLQIRNVINVLNL